MHGTGCRRGFRSEGGGGGGGGQGLEAVLYIRKNGLESNFLSLFTEAISISSSLSVK